MGHSSYLGTGLPHLQGLEAAVYKFYFIGPKACKKGHVMLKVTILRNKIAVIQNSTEKVRSLPTNLELPVLNFPCT